LHVEGIENRRKVIGVEVDVDDGTDDGLDGTGLEVGRSGIGASSSDCEMGTTVSAAFPSDWIPPAAMLRLHQPPTGNKDPLSGPK